LAGGATPHLPAGAIVDVGFDVSVVLDGDGDLDLRPAGKLARAAPRQVVVLIRSEMRGGPRSAVFVDGLRSTVVGVSAAATVLAADQPLGTASRKPKTPASNLTALKLNALPLAGLVIAASTELDNTI